MKKEFILEGLTCYNFRSYWQGYISYTWSIWNRFYVGSSIC